MSSTLTDISGVGPDTAKLLMEHSLTSPSEIAGAAIERLCALPGFGAIRAGKLIKAANELLTVTTENAATATKVATRPRRTTQKPTPESTTGNKPTNVTKPDAVKKVTKKEQEKLKKAKKAAAKKTAAKKAKKAAAMKAAAKKAKKATAKKAAAMKAAAKKAKKATAKKAAAKKAAAKKAKKAKSKKNKK